MKQIIILLSTLALCLAKSADLPISTTFKIDDIQGDWVLSVQNDNQQDNLERSMYYGCHTMTFQTPSDGIVNYTESFFAPFFGQYNYWNKTTAFYYDESVPQVLYKDAKKTLPIYYVTYQDATSVLLLSNVSSSFGIFALGLTRDQAGVTDLYPIGEKICKDLHVSPAFYNMPNPNQGCKTIVNSAMSDDKFSFYDWMNTYNITVAYAPSIDKGKWLSYNCPVWNINHNYFLDMYYEVNAWNEELKTWKQIHSDDFNVDPTKRSVWQTGYHGPVVALYYQQQGEVRRAIVLSGDRSFAYFMSNYGSPTTQDLALFGAKLLQAGIKANPLTDYVSLKNRDCGKTPPVMERMFDLN